MATTVPDPKKGDLVYPVYTPQRAGKVISVKQGEGIRGLVLEIQMANGRVYHAQPAELRDLRALHEEHRRKAESLAGVIDQLERMS